jgi:transcription elongation factor Elf1
MEKPELIEDLGMHYATALSKKPCRMGLFKCPFCGNLFVTKVQSVKSGNTISCQCFHHSTRNPMGHIGMSSSKMYRRWSGIIDRVKNYGDRGISVCEEWLKFENFYNWSINNGYSEELQIDRIDNDGDYSPENCRWVKQSINMLNTRPIYRNNTSGFKNVVFKPRMNKWEARCRYLGKVKVLGYYVIKEDAARAIDSFVIEHGLPNKLHFPQSKQQEKEELAI